MAEDSDSSIGKTALKSAKIVGKFALDTIVTKDNANMVANGAIGATNVAIGAVQTVYSAAQPILNKATEYGSETLDSFTRQDIDKQITEHILLQTHYNDLLAIKLNEALERITKLEQHIEKLSNR